MMLLYSKEKNAYRVKEKDGKEERKRVKARRRKRKKSQEELEDGKKREILKGK